MSRDSSVNKMTGYELCDWSSISGGVIGTSQPPMLCFLSSGLQESDRIAHLSPTCSPEFYNAC